MRKTYCHSSRVWGQETVAVKLSQSLKDLKTLFSQSASDYEKLGTTWTQHILSKFEQFWLFHISIFVFLYCLKWVVKGDVTHLGAQISNYHALKSDDSFVVVTHVARPLSINYDKTTPTQFFFKF